MTCSYTRPIPCSIISSTFQIIQLFIRVARQSWSQTIGVLRPSLSLSTFATSITTANAIVCIPQLCVLLAGRSVRGGAWASCVEENVAEERWHNRHAADDDARNLLSHGQQGDNIEVVGLIWVVGFCDLEGETRDCRDEGADVCQVLPLGEMWSRARMFLKLTVIQRRR